MNRRDPVLLGMTVLAVVAVVAATWFGLSWWTAAHDEAGLRARDRDTVLAAATDALTALNTIDYHDPGPALDRWIQVTTGQFGKNLSGDRQLQLDRAVTSRTIATASVRQAAVTELDEAGGTARVIAVVDVQLSTNGSAAAPSRSRLNATLTRTESGWKISAVQGAG
ncbi:hypothetical protein ORV05_06660 [Amycolatopsis cynarae]|uniref:Mce-associated membrane protein n=1 Tax=Amycolatopsis cynarae TaxID=2995223 RepID=A0ABY7B687_9PSEU|nr:hypothetical protein [Amycolatopsis sp. HUAS 11-8]WAL67460.1 hypothetical protein ORV05_06660 [Amycolatopsis sp. HUAS 11-8]